ncbi:MAG: hypothetical protein E6G19_00740, partial [Actinobacteria bacterium]
MTTSTGVSCTSDRAASTAAPWPRPSATIVRPTSSAATTTSASIARASSARSGSGSRCFASSPRNGITIVGTGKDTIEVSASGNAALADRLESFAALLELADDQYHAVRAYRRAAEVIRSTPAPVAELVRSGRARELRGIGPGIEGRLRELVETGDIQELVDLERELAPELIGLGRLLGIGAKRGVEVGRALGISTLEELREAAAEGRLQEVPGIGPQTERKLVEALRATLRPKPPHGLLLNRAWTLSQSIADAFGAEVAGDPRRFKDSSERLAVVACADGPKPLLDEFERLPQI